MATTQRTWIGKRRAAPEDPRAADGAAPRYTDDVRLAGHAARRGAAQPACRTRGSCASTRAAARALPGVLAVHHRRRAGQELIRPAARASAPRRSSSTRWRSTRSATPARPWRRGRRVALHWPRTRSALIEVEYELLPLRGPIAGGHAAGRADGAREPRRRNVVYEKTLTFGDVDGDFAAADRVIRRRLRWPRASASPLETAGAVCRFNPATRAHGRVVEHQHAQLRRLGGVRHAEGGAEQADTSIPMYVGGSFGSKHFAGQGDRHRRAAWPSSRAAP